MRPVSVVILLPPAVGASETPLGWVELARSIVAEGHRVALSDLGVADVRVVTESREGRPFGAMLRDLARDVLRQTPGSGLVVVGGASMPLATRDDLATFIETAGATD